MEHPRSSSAAAFAPSLGLVISGGLKLSSVVQTFDGLKFKELLPLPVRLRGHCMVALGDRSLFITGGLTNDEDVHSAKSYVYESNEWQSKPRLPMPRGSQSLEFKNIGGPHVISTGRGMYNL